LVWGSDFLSLWDRRGREGNDWRAHGGTPMTLRDDRGFPHVDETTTPTSGVLPEE